MSLWIVGGVLAAMLVAVAVPYIRSGRLSETGAAAPAGYHAYCIDLSHHNGGGIVWDSLRVAIDHRGRTTKDLLKAREIRPVTGIYFKATEGLSFEDRLFAAHWEEAGECGLRRGAYHFFRPAADPAVQAEHFIRTVGPLRYDDLPPVLDIETLPRGCTPERLNGNALIWLQAVEEHYGRTPWVYASDSYVRDILSADITDNYPLWIARYGGKAPAAADWAMWQFTDKAVVHGIPGYVDLSVLP